jgi:hypothetical protein
MIEPIVDDDADRLRLAGARCRAGLLSAEITWRAAHVDEDFQAEHWGTYMEAKARRRAFAAAAIVVAVGARSDARGARPPRIA